MNRGDIYLCDLGNPIGHEQGDRRPVVIVSRDEMSRFGIPVVVPVSRTRKEYPTHVELEGVLPVTSYVQCEHLRTVSTERFIRHVGTVDGIHMMKIELVLRRILGLT
ncbi:type II toxin-antitoxin system PemK/MazF family toxin [Glycomyces buryatensis]|uniref:mRNA interferase n=1 Tax=Glycomyces buryatensis TaxID=2570927 RepID=A0A4V4HSR0_9ACTN|nr:type II toxin-antitoxin system PemK/MazF family toxin [Glycomyces buryatensis]THV42636.1 type II toxin-antitoxin system PemK/MazF family toxin [Glycomyces buryatensis]